MYLSKLEIFGFKTFPEKTKLEFAQGVSAIVGPNGSGKSNIVDALRWVLGEQGDRALRSEKRDDVVFSGTKIRKPLSIAEVSLTIDNSSRKLQTEFTEVQIARRFFRSGDTEYFLNGTKVRLKDLKSLLADSGIAPDAYSVIELKMVDAILSSVKNERRKMFEEAAGIITYKQNRDLTFKRLESVRDSLNRVSDIIREKQRNINILERQVKRNEEAKTVFEELRKLELLSGNYEYYSLECDSNEIKEHESENLALKEKLRTEIEEYEKVIDSLLSEISILENTFEELSGKLDEKKEEINRIEKFNLVSEQKINNYESNISRLTLDNEVIEKTLSGNKIKEEDINKKIAILKNTLIISEKSLEEKKQKVDKTISEINERKNDLLHLGNKLKTVSKSLSESKTAYEQNKARFENNLERMKSLSVNTESSLLEIKKYQVEKNNLETKLKSEEDELRNSERNLREKTEEKLKFEEKIKNTDSKINNLKLDIQKKSTKISYLENLIESFEDYTEGIQYLLKNKEFKGIKTVIDSIKVDEKYKIAIETALGEISNYLIVDDSRRLLSYIDALNESGKGKVTFILNDKLFDNPQLPFTDFEEYEPDFLSEKGVLGFASKFISASSDTEKLLNYLLDEYIIVENIETAFKLTSDSFYKFITLDGDIVTRGVVRAGSVINEDNIKIGRKERIVSLKETLDVLQSELNNLELELNNLSDYNAAINLKTYQDDFSGKQSLINKTKSDIAVIDFKIDSLNKSIADDETEYKKLQSENITLDDARTKIGEIVNNYEVEQTNLESELSFLTTEFENIEKIYTEYYTDYNSFNLEVLKLQNELKNEESSLIRITNSLENQKRLFNKNFLQIEKENKLCEEYKNKVEASSLILDEHKKELEKVISEYDNIKKQLDDLRTKQNKQNSEQRQRVSSLDRVSNAMVNSQIRLRENKIKSEQIFDYIRKKYEYQITNPELYFKEEPLYEEYKNDEGFSLTLLKKDIEELDARLKKLGGGYQQLVWDNFQTEKDELQRIIEQRNDLLESEKDIKKTIEKINNEARERFLKTFEEIRENFIRIFKELFQEGDEANLKLLYEQDDEGRINEDPLEAKIDISAKPRGKRPTSIEQLSGGEKTLTAIALLFAIYLVKPSPFCVLDEVDAPLDVANLGRFNHMIRKFSTKTQFILITHNERTMETVDRLYGVTMQEPGVTTIVETKFKQQ